MITINIQQIPEAEQRYPTLGDWWFETPSRTAAGLSGPHLQIRTSAADEDQAFLYALHELVEAWLCKSKGITTAEVDAFDMDFERARAQGVYGEDDEPGDHPDAPYRDSHRVAMLIEHLVARELGLLGYGEVR